MKKGRQRSGSQAYVGGGYAKGLMQTCMRLWQQVLAIVRKVGCPSTTFLDLYGDSDLGGVIEEPKYVVYKGKLGKWQRNKEMQLPATYIIPRYLRYRLRIPRVTPLSVVSVVSVVSLVWGKLSLVLGTTKASQSPPTASFQEPGEWLRVVEKTPTWGSINPQPDMGVDHVISHAENSLDPDR